MSLVPERSRLYITYSTALAYYVFTQLGPVLKD